MENSQYSKKIQKHFIIFILLFTEIDNLRYQINSQNKKEIIDKKEKTKKKLYGLNNSPHDNFDKNINGNSFKNKFDFSNLKQNHSNIVNYSNKNNIIGNTDIYQSGYSNAENIKKI